MHCDSIQTIPRAHLLAPIGFLLLDQENDLALIKSYRPDLIVGDFRLSLSISARVAGIPYAAISSAHWSPYYRHAAYPMPVLPLNCFSKPAPA